MMLTHAASLDLKIFLKIKLENHFHFQRHNNKNMSLSNYDLGYLYLLRSLATSIEGHVTKVTKHDGVDVLDIFV